MPKTSQRIDKLLQAILRRLDKIESNMATRNELKAIQSNMATRNELKAIEGNMITKAEFSSAIKELKKGQKGLQNGLAKIATNSPNLKMFRELKKKVDMYHPHA